MKIITNSQLPEEKKDPTNCTVFAIYKAIAEESEIKDLEQQNIE